MMTNQEITNMIDLRDKETKEMMINAAMMNIGNVFENWTVQEVMKDLRVSEATANAIFKRPDFPSVNIGKTKTVTILAYLLWKMERKESEVNADGNRKDNI